MPLHIQADCLLSMRLVQGLSTLLFLEQAEVYVRTVEIYVDSNILIDALHNKGLKYKNFEKENQS